ncbi:MAG: hypothetical protein HN494_07020 [Opitutae bacterium]|nr:hypothetical protein [Opitutae bacterium]MBT6852145.1 hypothetical protein [Opitutae bacterium]
MTFSGNTSKLKGGGVSSGNPLDGVSTFLVGFDKRLR